MKNLLVSVLSALLLAVFANGAYAYSIAYDNDGTSTNPTDNTTDYSQWNLTPTQTSYTLSSGETIKEDDGDIAFEDLWTVQDIDTGYFTETFTVVLVSGQVDDGTGTTDYFTSGELTYIDMTLTGYYYDDTNIVFSTGIATMYTTVNGSAVTIAELEMTYALTTELVGSLLGNGLEMSLNLAFSFLSVNDAYWSEEVENLVALNWVLALTSGDIDQESVTLEQSNITTDVDQYVIGWTLDGFAATFEVVPEPTTMLLFGLGLLGFAGAVRRKNS